MNPVIFFTGYLGWHYSRAFIDILIVWSNFFWFTAHLFSIKQLILTLFSPWKRMHDHYERTGIEVFLTTLVVNTISRILGVLIRTILLLIGFSALLLVVVGVVFFIVFWLFAPIVLGILLFTGVQYFI